MAMLTCLVINLARCSDRLAHMRAMFASLDASFERIEAVDGTQLAAETVAQTNARNRWVRPLVRAEIGCLLSHRACWQRIAAGPAPFGAIFEDDIRLSAAARPFLSGSAWIPPDADLVKLETRNRAVIVSRKSLAAGSGHRLLRLFSFHDGLAGYVVSQRCARWLCEQTEHCVAPVDQLVLNPDYGIFGRLQVYQLSPAICMPEQLASRAEGSSHALPSTIDADGRLYESDEALLKPSGARPRGYKAARALRRIAASLRRAAHGRTKVRIQYA